MSFLQKIAQMLLGISLLSGAYAASFEEGKDYITLKAPIPNAANTVTEVISYRCIHCFNHHKFGTLEQLKAKIPNMTYNLYHTNFGQGYSKELNILFAYASMQDAKAGKDASDKTSLTQQLAAAYFASYFDKKEKWEEEKNFEKFNQIGLNVLKVSQADLDKFFATREAKEKLRDYAIGDAIAFNYGTPAFVVNGKYQIIPTAFDSLELLALIIEELQQKP